MELTNILLLDHYHNFYSKPSVSLFFYFLIGHQQYKHFPFHFIIHFAHLELQDLLIFYQCSTINQTEYLYHLDALWKGGVLCSSIRK